MRGKHEEGFNQRDTEDGNDHDRDHFPDLPHHPGHKKQGTEGHDVGEDTENDRDLHLPGPVIAAWIGPIPR